VGLPAPHGQTMVRPLAVDSGMRPGDAIDIAIGGHAQVLTAAVGLDNDQIAQPSLLPGWSRARVIAHLAHKSWSHVAVFEGAVVGDVRAQYPQRQVAAEGETEAWSVRTSGELHELLRDGFAALERSWERLPEDGWVRRGMSSAGERSMTEFVERHLRDVFVHYVDLGVGYGPQDWPEAFVSTELSKRLRDLPGRAEPHAMLAWLLGRSPAPELTPW
jgi:maleylpyruvate isomerase